MLLRLIFAAAMLVPVPARAAFIDSSPPTDLLGNWKFDLYDFAGQQRGTSSNPLYINEPLDVTTTAANITTQDLVSATISQQAGQVSISGAATPGSFVATALNSTQTTMIVISGTWTGTLSVEVSSDNGTTYQPRSLHITGSAIFASSITQNVTGTINGTAKTHLRVRATAPMTGTATVKYVISANLSNVYIGNAIKIADGTATASPAMIAVKAGGVPALASDSATVTEDRPFLSRVVSGNATTVIKTGAGIVHSIMAGNASGGTITVYDNTAGSGTLLTFFYAPTPSGGLLSGSGVPPSVTTVLDIGFSTGLTVVTAGSNNNSFTVIYR